MKILFDPQIFQVGYSGIQRYYSVLYSGLIDAGIEIVFPQETPFSKDPSKKSFYEKILHPKLNRALHKFRFYRKRKTFYQALANSEYDLAYITSQDFETEFLNHIQKKPYVMTVHDIMQIARGPHSLVDQPRDSLALGYIAEYATCIACVSEYTKKDLCNKYLINRSKTKTVYLANFLDSAGRKMNNLPENYILNVGTRNGRKNFFEWIKAVSPYLKDHPALYVIVTGGLAKSEKYFYKKLGILDRIVSRENVTDAELITLYQKALCLVYPSLYEGFGLPVIEAMANGCPVIASNCTSIPEVGGSAVLYIDPTDPKNMLNVFEKFIESPKLQNKLSEQGVERSKKFSKEKFISEMITLFEQAIQNYRN